jgi:Uma2 family endonuclease
MSTITPTQSRTFPPPPAYRLTVEEYERLAGAGVLDDPRVELIDGYLVQKMSKNPPHIWVTGTIIDILTGLLSVGWSCRKEDPVRIPRFDEPEPDVAVVRGSRDDYRSRLPEPSDVALVVEVAETTLDRDQGKKWDAYAHGRIPVYWIVDLVHRQVEVHTDPGPGGYKSCQVFTSGQEVPVIIDGVEVGRIAVAAILP